MKQVSYFIGTNPYRRSSKKLNLWRNHNGVETRIAIFTSHSAAELFAQEFGFPLSEGVKTLINTVHVTGQDDE